MDSAGMLVQNLLIEEHEICGRIWKSHIRSDRSEGSVTQALFTLNSHFLFLMANYLPVLLVSVSTNAVPDDSSLVTLPRGQVDYLSHEWQEEDVWRSWRNMTRQKNEIANGARLENASWRTWWKQRNKLKTVSPETLNWLKDSDVTWLYGPLHTAVEWTPPPKPGPVPDSVDGSNPASALDRLDLSNSRRQPAPSKPILKHRSISELLTSDFPPTSPIFSPVESEDDEQHDPADPASSVRPGMKHRRPSLTHTKSDTHITRWGASRAFRKDSPPRIDPPGFDSTNPNYFPPEASTATSSLHQLPASHQPSAGHQPLASHQSSAGGSIRTSLSQDSNSSTSGGERTHKKKHISFNTFVEQCIAIEKPKKNASGFFGVGNHNEEGEWIEGRSGFVDDDGYDEDQEDSEEEDLVYGANLQWEQDGEEMGARAIRSDSDSPIEEEEDDDDEEDDGVIEMRSSSTYRTRSNTIKAKSTPKKPPRSQSKVSTASSSSSTSTSTTTSSSSAASHSTTGTSTSSPSHSLSPSRRNASWSNLHRKTSTSSSTSNLTVKHDPSQDLPQRRLSNSTYRPSFRRGNAPPLIRTPSEHVHVTIAPIAPTILKTTGAWSEGFGDEVQSDNDGFGMFGGGWPWSVGSAEDKKGKGRGGKGRSDGSGGYSSGNGAVNANGYGPFGTTTSSHTSRHHGRGHGFNNLSTGAGLGLGGDGHYGDDPDAQVSDGTPVELVYVPPFGSNYSLGLGEAEGEPEAYGRVDGGIYRDRAGVGAGPYYGYAPRGYVEEDDDDNDRAYVEDVEREEGEGAAVYHHPPVSSSPASVGIGSTPIPIHSNPSAVPTVVVDGAQSRYTGNKAAASSGNGFSAVVGAASTSAPNTSYMMQMHGQRATAGVEEEDAYDFFEGPDLGEDYFYARRGGRSFERERERERPLVAASGLAAARDLDRGSDRRPGRSIAAPASEQRQSRSRSRSQSRTPSPAYLSSPATGAPTANSSAMPLNNASTTTTPTPAGRRRSSSASSPSGPGTWMSSSYSTSSFIAPSAYASNSGVSADLLSPPSRGRQPDVVPTVASASLLSSARPPPAAEQRQSRGRSSTRTPSSSSSWDRDRDRSLGGTSPIGSLSPDGGVRANAATRSSSSATGIGAVLESASVLASGGRLEKGDRDRELRDVRDQGQGSGNRRGRERRGRDRTSGKVLSASETESVGRGDGTDASSVGGGSIAEAEAEDSSTGSAVGMEASFYSTGTASSGSSNNSNTSTVMPSIFVPEAAADLGDVEMRDLRRAEEDQRRRVHPTPSNSPVVEVRRMAPADVGKTFVILADVLPPSTLPPPSTSTNTSSGGATPTKEVTSPSMPGSFSTSQSFSPSTPTSPPFISPATSATATSPTKMRPPPLIPSPPGPAKPSTSFTAVSSPRTGVTPAALLPPQLPPPGGSVSPHTSPSSESTIVGKAVDMMSSAGVFFGLWGRDVSDGA